jgi:hypothetical protein
MKKIFISYSSLDKKRLKVMKDLITKTEIFEAIIIADNREALRPLATKVQKGIRDSDYFVPILTENSKYNQWVNQEIGYATALDKKIIPITESQIINDLKGFIHKNIDLPYVFNSNKENKYKESYEYNRCCRQLISDLSEGIKGIEILNETESIPTQVEHKDPIVSRAVEKGKIIIWRKEKKEYLETPKALYEANNEVTVLYNELESLVTKVNNELKEKFYLFGTKDKPDRRVIISDGNYSLFIRWTIFYSNSLYNAHLNICLFQGYLSMDNVANQINKVKPLVQDLIYKFDISDNQKDRGWSDISNSFMTSTELANNWFNTLSNYVKT